jgi:monovalent cation/hydrogen antiporter
MTATIQTILLLLAVLVIVAIVARRLNTAPSILLVIAGIGLALTPGLPRIEIAPELVLLGILPPLIYSAGVTMSWREFRFNLRPISLLAFGCVTFTTCAIAAVAHWLIGMPLAVGFVLGAIVAPPDVVAPLAIVRRLGVPRRLIVVLEGEGLASFDPLPLCGCRGGHRTVLLRARCRNFCSYCDWGDRVRNWHRLVQPALAPLGG